MIYEWIDHGQDYHECPLRNPTSQLRVWKTIDACPEAFRWAWQLEYHGEVSMIVAANGPARTIEEAKGRAQEMADRALHEGRIKRLLDNKKACVKALVLMKRRLLSTEPILNRDVSAKDIDFAIHALCDGDVKIHMMQEDRSLRSKTDQ